MNRNITLPPTQVDLYELAHWIDDEEQGWIGDCDLREFVDDVMVKLHADSYSWSLFCESIIKEVYRELYFRAEAELKKLSQ